MNGFAPPGDPILMSESRNSETCSGNTTRCYDLAREWVVEGAGLLIATIVTNHYNLNSFLALVVVFTGTYAFARVIGAIIWHGSITWLSLLTGLLLISTLMHAGSTMQLLPALLLTVFLPGIAQAYLIWALWPATGSLLHPLPLLSLAWLVMLAIWAFEPVNFRRLTTAWRGRC